MSLLDAQTGIVTRNYICMPIIVGNAICGGIILSNKVLFAEESTNLPRQSPRNSSADSGYPSFGPADEILLGYLAVNAGLLIKSSTSRGKRSSSFVSVRSNRGARSLHYDIDSTLQQLVDRACVDLDADLISVFAYNSSTKRLESTVSNGSKALSIPVDSGIAGTSFRTARVINIQETVVDERCCGDSDSLIGSKTQSLLCAPILDAAGRPVGVIQALNKKGSAYFTRHDETLICEFSSQVFSLLRDSDFLSEYPGDSSALQVAKFLAALSNAKSVSTLACEVRRVVMEVVACDFVGLYTHVPSDGMAEAYLQCENSSGNSSTSTSTLSPNSSPSSSSSCSNGVANRIIGANIPHRILDAINTGLRTELSVLLTSPPRSAFENFLPGVTARHALIYPLHSAHQSAVSTLTGIERGEGKGLKATPKSVLVVIRNNQRLLGFPTAARDALDLFVAVLKTCTESVRLREQQELSVSTVESSFLLANATLGALSDFVILLGPSGRMVAWNRDLSALLGPEAERKREREGNDDADLLSPSPSVPAPVSVGVDGCGSWLQSRLSQKAEKQDHESEHFSKWFKRINCSDLVVDTAKATDPSRGPNDFKVLKSSIFTSAVYPAGVAIEYQLLPLDAECVMKGDVARSIVLVIRVHDNCCSYSASASCPSETTRGQQEHRSSSNASMLSLPVNSEAHRLIVAATTMLKGIAFDHAASKVMHEIGEITSTLDFILKSESQSGPRSPNSPKNHHRNMSLYQDGLVNLDVGLPENLFTWDFNVLEIQDKTVLINVMGQIFESLNLLGVLGIEPIVLANYIRDIANKYHDNPFHNLHHASCVTHFAYMLIRATEAERYLSPQQLFGVVISAVVHDVDHPGNTNMFEINSQSYLALLYNDQSVLENHHCSTAFQLMRGASTNILKGLSKTVATDLRKTIVSCVMATDMSVHFQLVDETKKIVQQGDYSFTEAQDQMFLCRLLVHSADLSNPVRPFHITQSWARRISAEFNLQVAMEQELGMPVLNFMMTPDDKSLCKNETGFSSFVVAPMWRSLSVLFPSLAPLTQQLDCNLTSWKTMLEQIMKEEDAEKGSA